MTWKDIISSVVVLGTGALYYAQSKGSSFFFSNSVRLQLALIFAVGMSLCIFGSRIVPGEKTTWSKLASAIGIATMLVLIVGLVTAAPITVTISIALIFVLWFLTTASHLLDIK